MFENSRKRE
jgi:opacity protein-like surface antigen